MKQGMLVTMLLAIMFVMVGSVYKADAKTPFFGEITVAAGETNVVSGDILLGDKSGDIGYRDLDSFEIINSSGTGTGTVTLVSSDMADTTILSAGAHIPGASTLNYPLRSYTEQSIAGWVVTGNVAVATSTIVTGYAKYGVRRAHIQITQPASATANTYRWLIKAD